MEGHADRGREGAEAVNAEERMERATGRFGYGIGYFAGGALVGWADFDPLGAVVVGIVFMVWGVVGWARG